MFLASEALHFREARVRRYLDRDPSVAVLLGAAHFESTICRAVLFLSGTPTTRLHQKLDAVYGLDRYKNFWRDELSAPHGLRPLPAIVENWHAVHEAFLWRTRLIHGRDRCTRNMATPKVAAMLEGAAFVWRFCAGLGARLNARLPVRRKARVPQFLALARPLDSREPTRVAVS